MTPTSWPLLNPVASTGPTGGVTVGVEGEDDVADDEETVVRVDVPDEEETVDDVSEFDNDKEDVEDAESEIEEVIGMTMDVVGVAEGDGDNTVVTEVGIGKVEGVAVVVNGVVVGGVAVVVIGDVRVVGDVVCGADGRITVGGNEDPP